MRELTNYCPSHRIFENGDYSVNQVDVIALEYLIIFT